MSSVIPPFDRGYLAVLFVRELASSRAFYVDLLGMSPTFEDDNSIALSTGSDTLLLINHEAADDLLGSDAVDHAPSAGSRAVLVHAVDDVDLVFRSLSERGVRFLREPEDRPWGLRCAHFVDPDGHVWEINTPMLSA